MQGTGRKAVSLSTRAGYLYQNCTESINAAIKGIVRPGDHVIISDLEHNAVYRVVESLRRQGIIQYDVAPVFADDQKRSGILNIFCAAIPD